MAFSSKPPPGCCYVMLGWNNWTLRHTKFTESLSTQSHLTIAKLKAGKCDSPSSEYLQVSTCCLQTLTMPGDVSSNKPLSILRFCSMITKRANNSSRRIPGALLIWYLSPSKHLHSTEWVHLLIGCPLSFPRSLMPGKNIQ